MPQSGLETIGNAGESGVWFPIDLVEPRKDPTTSCSNTGITKTHDRAEGVGVEWSGYLADLTELAGFISDLLREDIKLAVDEIFDVLV